MKKLILVMLALTSTSAFASKAPIAVCRGTDPVTGKGVTYTLSKTTKAPTFLSLTIKEAGSAAATYAVTSADPASTSTHVIVYVGSVYFTVDQGKNSPGTAGAMGTPQTVLTCDGNW